MQLMEGGPQVRALAGSCPDCVGDLAQTPIEGGWELACIHCGSTLRAMRRSSSRAGASGGGLATQDAAGFG